MMTDNEIYGGYDPFEDMSDEDRMKAGCCQLVIFILTILAAVLIASTFTSCKTQYVPIPQVHETHHWHTDSVTEKDSTYYEKQTVIRELDSVAMARYGITLKAAERAWLVQTSEMEARLRELAQMSITRDTVRDSIPVPYPVATDSQQTTLTWWQEFMMGIGFLVTVTLSCMGILWLWSKARV